MIYMDGGYFTNMVVIAFVPCVRKHGGRVVAVVGVSIMIADGG